MAYEKITNLDLDIKRDFETKTCAAIAFAEKARLLEESLRENGLYDEGYRDTLAAEGIDEITKEPYGYETGNMNAETVLALLSAIADASSDSGHATKDCLASGLIGELIKRLENIDYENRPLPRWIEDTAEKILSGLQKFPSDEETTIGRAMQPYLKYIDKNGDEHTRALSTNDEFDIVAALHRKAKNFGLYLDSSAYEDMAIGLPTNIPFIVRRVPVGSEGPKTLFSFTCGGFFDGYSHIIIKAFSDSIVADRFTGLGNPERVSFPVTEEQITKLDDLLSHIGAKDWSSYWAPVLDGTQWSMSFRDETGLHESDGSNAFPEGFDELVDFLAEEFGYCDPVCEDGSESAFSENRGEENNDNER